MMRQPAQGPIKQRRNGFTLVELLVALTLIALLTGGLFTIFNLGVGGLTRAEQISAADEDLRVIHRFLARRFAVSTPFSRFDTDTDRVLVQFQGEQDRVQWIGDMPEFLPPGGPYTLVLQRRSDAQLQFSWAPYGSQDGPLARPTTRLLADGIESIELAYAASLADGDIAWQPRWLEQSQLPRLIRMRLRPAGQSWSEFVFDLKYTKLEP